MSILQNILIFFIAMSSLICATQDDSKEERKKYSSLVARSDREIAELKRKHQDSSKEVNEEKYTQPLFDAYMQKAAGHYHLGERDKQLGCYQEILGVKGLSKITLARTHVNISVVHIHLQHYFVAAAHLLKAEDLAPIQDIEQVIGAQTYNVFATTYDKTAQGLLHDHPKQALVYQKKAFEVPKQDKKWYSLGHLKLAVLYDTLLMSNDSLNHALQALNCKLLTSEEHDKALCYASLGSGGIGRSVDCIRYFEQIVNLKSLHKNEFYLVLSTVGSCYLSDRKWDIGIKLRHQAIDALEPPSPQYLLAKHNLATVYGESGNKEKEMELYGEVLEGIKRNTFDQGWQ